MLRWCILTICFLSLVSAAPAGPLSIFKKPPKPEPAEYVPALLETLKTDPDERKRQQAAEDLRDYDLKTFPDILTGLIEALGNDSSSSVRREALNAIGKLRPISQQAVYAVKEAVAKDDSIRVRADARAILLNWTVFHGISLGRPQEVQPIQTGEPPLAEPLPKSKAPSTTPPPLAESLPKSKAPSMVPPPPIKPPPTSRPLLPLFPSKNTKPEVKPREEGPVLNPPK